MLPGTTIRAYFALLWGILALTFSSLFVRWAEAPGLVTSFYRMLIATIVFAPFVIFSLYRKKFQISSELIFPLLAGISSGLDHAFWSTAINQTQVANATLLNNIAPVWVVLFGVIILRERLKFGFWLGFLLTLVGATLVLGNNLFHQPEFSRGDLLALVSSLWYAGYYLLSQRGRKKLPAEVFVGLASSVSCLTLLFAVTNANFSLTGYSSYTYLMFLGAGLISQVTGYFALVFALGHLPATIVSPSMVAQPVLTAVLAIPFVGEPLSDLQIIGGLATLVGVYIINQYQARLSTISIVRTKAPVISDKHA